MNMDQHLTLNTFKKVKQIQELITEEVTEFFYYYYYYYYHYYFYY